ncbi:hypothetical protein [Caulobacter sp. S45]|uniref:hypothetical protein n=1 Tax=Caulobacter sp. S45 TaxID=1641861 RepID=UPI001575D376|nr:hypothetical protein [Caulobacter sp. S45]
MKTILAAMFMVGLTAQAAGAQAWDGVPDGVQRVDGRALHQQVLADQMTCRDKARTATNGQMVATYIGAGAGGALAAIALNVGSGVAANVAANRKFNRTLDECMASQGYAPAEPSSEDLAAYKSATAAGLPRDPYAYVVSFKQIRARVTSVVETSDASGNPVQTYSVGRF